MCKSAAIKLLPVIFIAIAAIYTTVLVLAADFTASSTPSSGTVNTDTRINLTITNTNASHNITQVNISLNISLPSGSYFNLTFVAGSNATNANNTAFTNNETVLTWYNSTTGTTRGIISPGATAWFAFNVTSPEKQGNYNITITTVDSSGTVNSTNVSFAIVPAVLSSDKTFGISPGSIFLNWTNSYTKNATLTANTSLLNNLILSLRSDLTPSKLTPNYSQSTLAKCQTYIITVINSSAQRGNTTHINATLNGNTRPSENVTFHFGIADTDCNPGRYSTESFIIQNASDSTINISFRIVTDLPISTNNTLSNTTGIGTFAGTIPGNATSVQSYYFFINNATSILNATGAKINISWSGSSKNIDLFLLDQNGKLRGKSTNTSTTSESILFNYFPSAGETWEIRVFGNDTSPTSWSGTIYFTTLNITETSDTNKRLDIIDLGAVNVSTQHQKNITLINDGNLTINNITQQVELFYVKRFSGNGEKNFTFLVPDSTIADRVLVSVNWTGSGNYSFNVISPNSTILFSSVNKNRLSNQSGVEQEEFAEKFDLPSNPEIWTVWVKNNSLASDYNVTVKVRLDTSSRFSSNFSSTTLDRSTNFGGTGNSTYNVTLSFNVTNSTLDGLYEGKVSYLDNRGVGVEIPIRMNVTTPMVLINNSYKNIVISHKDNIGYDRNFTTRLVFSNNGTWPASISFTNSSSKLTCVSGGCQPAAFANLTFTSVSSLAKDTSQQIDVSIGFNNSHQAGIYEGWIFAMANSSTISDSSRPAETFNITIKLNLTNEVDVKIVKAVDASTEVSVVGNEGGTSSDSEISLAFDLFFVNGTKITPSNAAIANSSITNVYLQEGNVSDSTGRIPTSGSLTISNWSFAAGQDLFCTANCPGWTTANHYFINATLRPLLPGGLYTLFVGVGFTSNGTFNGTGNQTSSLIVNNTGLRMQALNSTTISFSSSTDFFLNITNFGPRNETSYIKLEESCSGYSASNPSLVSELSNGCNSVENAANSSIKMNAFGGSCVIKWTITNSTPSAAACTANIKGAPQDNWFNPSGVNLSVTVSLAESGDTTTGTTTTTSTTSTTTSTTAPPTYLNFTSATDEIKIVQGESGTARATVKNTNTSISQTVTLSIEGIESSWFTITNPVRVIAKEASETYSINFTVPIDAAVKDYVGTYKATSSQASVTKPFTLRVLPSEETKAEINSTFNEIKANFTKVWEEYNKTLAAGVNLTSVEGKFNDLKSQVERAESLIAAGTDDGYFEALQLFETIRQLMREVADEIEAAKRAQSLFAGIENILIYVGIGFGLAAAGFLIYLFWPTKGEEKKVTRKPGVQMPSVQNVKENIDNSLNKVKDLLKKKKEKEFKYKYVPSE